MKNSVHFVGAGPGAPDLITVRGRALLSQADLVIYAGSLVNPTIMECCQDHCRKVDSSKLSLEETTEEIRQAMEDSKFVVRLHTGDPALYGAIGEQMRKLDALQIPYEVTPGITSLFAAAAELKKELTLPGVSQSIVLTRTAGRTPMPAQETVQNFAGTGATLAFYLSASNIEKLMLELIEGGRTKDTPVAVVYRVGWPNQKIVTGTIDTICLKVKEAGISRQAVILVGDVLSGEGEESLLYDSYFSHGYRNHKEEEQFFGAVAIYAFSKDGIYKGEEICRAMESATLFVPQRYADLVPDAVAVPSGAMDATVAAQWKQFGGHLFMGASGIAVRMIAPLLESKAEDPAVVVAGETGKQIISLAGGHLAGANRLARKIARITGGESIITTATDGAHLLAIDEIASRHHWRVENRETIKEINSALLEKIDVDLLVPEAIYETYYSTYKNLRLINSVSQQKSDRIVLFNPTEDDIAAARGNALILRPKQFILGLGCRKGTCYETLQESLKQFCEKVRITPSQIVGISSATVKKEEQGLLKLAEKMELPLSFFRSEQLTEVSVPSPSTRVQNEIGTPSVAEASAILASNGKLVIPKQKCGDHTFALAEIPQTWKGSVTVVGLSSGSAKHITPEVSKALREATTIAGYTKYVDFVRSFTAGKQLIESGMRGEIDRCAKTLEAALRGETVCMVCSGDAGILAMAGLLYEMQAAHEEYTSIPITVKPGITAATLAASVLGAPLQNGFSLISLSDLLVPAEEVERNLRESAKSNLSCVLYNPAGMKRRALLAKAVEIFRQSRGDDTHAAIVHHAGRPQEEKWIGTLGELPESEVTMSSLILIGSDRMRRNGDTLFEDRGYGDKYGS